MTADSKQYVVLVDANDTELGVEEKLLAHQKGVLHRAVSVFVFDSSNRLLMQQRALSKYHSPGLWSNTCCGHPEPGESPADAGRRRLMDEMGIACELKRAGGFTYRADLGDGLTEHEYDHVFVGRFDGEPKPVSDEVAAYRWVALDDLSADITMSPSRYSTWLPLALECLGPISV